jgi:hypothetical protein
VGVPGNQAKERAMPNKGSTPQDPDPDDDFDFDFETDPEEADRSDDDFLDDLNIILSDE